eukprot:1906992-Pyramimonas_sp.AAC.1
MQEHAPEMQRRLQRGELDRARQGWMEIVRRTGLAHFAQKQKELDPTVSALRARRLELVRARSELRVELRG